MFNPNTAQRVNERYRRLLLGSGWTLPESGAELALNYDFVAQPNLDPQINPFTGAPAGPTLDFVRTTTKKFSDWEGILRTVLAGEASFTGCRRVENLHLRSTDLANNTWNANETTLSANIANPLTGALDAFLLTENTADAVHNLTHAAGVITAGDGLAYSIYAKSNGRHFQLVISSNIAVSGVANYDLINGVVGNKSASVTSSSIKDVGDGWFRCSFYIASVVTGTGNINPSLITTPASGRTQGYEGNGTSGVYLYGPQSENVSGQADISPSEYQETTTVSVAQTFPLQKNGLPFPTAALGLLPAEARTNLCLQSEDFSTTWSAGGNTLAVVGNEAIAPDGTLTADKIIDDSGGSTGVVSIVQSGKVVVVSTVYCMSVYAKADQLDELRFDFSNNVGVNTQFFDLGSGGSVGNSGGNILKKGIIPGANGWFRCWATFTSDSSDTTGNFEIDVAEGAGITVSLDGTSSIFLWGAQIEKGVFPTSYIPTVASTVTRNGDVITATDETFYNQDGGTFYIKHHVPFVGTANAFIFSISRNGSSPRFLHYRSSGVSSAMVSDGDGLDTLVLASSDWSDGDTKQIVTAYATNDVILYVDGSQIETDNTYGTKAPPLSKIEVGSFSATSYVNGHIAQIRYYNARATNAESADLSSGLLSP